MDRASRMKQVNEALLEDKRKHFKSLVGTEVRGQKILEYFLRRNRSMFKVECKCGRVDTIQASTLGGNLIFSPRRRMCKQCSLNRARKGIINLTKELKPAKIERYEPMIKESDLEQVIAEHERLLEIAVTNMTATPNKPKLRQAWAKEADRLSARLSAFQLALSGAVRKT